MNKPTTLLIEEFKQNISKLINESGLPAFVLEYIIKDLYSEISDLSVKIAQNEKTEYIQSLKEDTESASDSSNI